jgi:hypothetical protein
LPVAIEAASRQWMAWKITCQIRKDYDIPTGLPYLTGFVFQEGINDECQAT